MKSIETVLILHDIRSAENVGSLLRTADAAGVQAVFLSSITPGIIDRFGRTNSKVTKASLGAERSVPTTHYDDITELIASLKRQAFTIIAIEQSSQAVDYKDITITEKTAFILGTETTGLSDEVLELADMIAEIPMSGTKESLNVAVAGGIALFRMLNI